MKYFLITLLACLLIISGCSMFQPIPSKKVFYKRNILEWQERMKKEGWTDNLVDDIVHTSIALINYKFDEDWEDYWCTPNEVELEFAGDCEDIAIFAYSSLKRLGYPYSVRIEIVTGDISDHALLKVKMPSSVWKRYETVPFNKYTSLGLSWIIYRHIMEFDVQGIYE